MCNLCETKPVYEFTNKRKVCKKCFIKYIQKKFLYTIRKFDMINKRDVVEVDFKKDFRTIVLIELLNLFVDKGIIEIVAKSSRKKKDKIAVALTTDLEAQKFVEILFNNNFGNSQTLSPVNKKIIKPLYLFLDKEVLLYAQLKGLKFIEPKNKKDELSEFVNVLEKKHPEIKRAIVNSYLELYN